MKTNFPSTKIYFVYAMTFCELTVYTEEVAFARGVLEENDAEFLNPTDNDNWVQVDTRLWSNLIRTALPKLIEPCVLCKGVTIFLKTDSVETRTDYVEGCGQLCHDCAVKVRPALK